MRQRDPGVLRVPDDRRDRAERETPSSGIKSGPLEFPAQPRNQREHEHDGDQLKCVRVFAEKSEADRADRSAARTSENRGLRSSASQNVNMAADPKKDRERIDRHDETADVEDRSRR